ncbi:MAG: carboxymuconolactone decarboxylase family protein [Actinomycetota bacterium]
MSRIPLITARDDLDAGGRVAFDRIVESRGSILRPFAVLLHAPAMAERVAELGHVVRFESHLTDADRELVTLATGRAHGCAFVWGSHLEAARAAGVGPDTIAALEADGRDLGEREAALVSFVNELCETSSVSDATFRAAHDLIGTTATIELVLTIGYYTMLGYTMSACGTC